MLHQDNCTVSVFCWKSVMCARFCSAIMIKWPVSRMLNWFTVLRMHLVKEQALLVSTTDITWISLEVNSYTYMRWIFLEINYSAVFINKVIPCSLVSWKLEFALLLVKCVTCKDVFFLSRLLHLWFSIASNPLFSRWFNSYCYNFLFVWLSFDIMLVLILTDSASLVDAYKLFICNVLIQKGIFKIVVWTAYWFMWAKSQKISSCHH